MSRHTPGPWEVCGEMRSYEPTQVPGTIRAKCWGKSDMMGDYQGCIVASFEEAHGNRRHAYPESWANARLIAAAPDLLEACRKANTCASLPDDVRELIREALRKAQGND